MDFLDSREAQSFRPDPCYATLRQPDLETFQSDIKLFDKDVIAGDSPPQSSSSFLSSSAMARGFVVRDASSQLASRLPATTNPIDSPVSPIDSPSSLSDDDTMDNEMQSNRANKSEVSNVASYHHNSNVLLKQLFEERMRRTQHSYHY